MSRWIRVPLGILIGLGCGLLVTVGTLVARARLMGRYLDNLGDAVGWPLTPLFVALAAGIGRGWRGGRLALATLSGTAVGLAAGMPLGAAVGLAVSGHAEIVWVGATIGAALGVAVGAVAGLLRGARPRRAAAVPAP